MKKYIPWLIGGGIVLILIILSIAGYNSMMTAETEVENAWADVQSQYQRRKDLIPNLENTVKKYAEHESSTFENVTKERVAAQNAQNAANVLPAEMPEDEQQMAKYTQIQAEAARAFSVYVNAVTEAYPDLKADKNFLEFQSQLEGTENRIQVARAKYNEAVMHYNQKIRRFPNVLFSGIMGFQKKSSFQADADAATAPQVFND